MPEGLVNVAAHPASIEISVRSLCEDPWALPLRCRPPASRVFHLIHSTWGFIACTAMDHRSQVHPTNSIDMVPSLHAHVPAGSRVELHSSGCRNSGPEEEAEKRRGGENLEYWRAG